MIVPYTRIEIPAKFNAIKNIEKSYYNKFGDIRNGVYSKWKGNSTDENKYPSVVS